MTAVRWGQSSSGKCHLASCGDDGSVRVWDAEAGVCVHVFDKHDSVRRRAGMHNDWAHDISHTAGEEAVRSE